MPDCPNCGHPNSKDARFCQECGASFTVAHARRRAARRPVTVVFCDVAGSTALGEWIDPEALRALLAGYFERMKAIVERHGGTVEKFIGDAVMAVFGVPSRTRMTRFGPAGRPSRCATRSPELGLEAASGSTPARSSTGTEERLATGDAVNVAARLRAGSAARRGADRRADLPARP